MTTQERTVRTVWAFAAGFALCMLMTRVFVTNDPNWSTWLSAIVIPMGIRRSIRPL